MARKKKHEEHENHERWVISYADFITLLFAFFVVMYGMASVNEGKYKRFSAALKVAFKVFEKPMESEEISTLVVQSGTTATESSEDEQDATGEDQVDTQVKKEFQGFINGKKMQVSEDSRWIKIEVNSGVLFDSGTARLEPSAIPIIDELGEMLQKTTNRIFVEGHTDDIPINTRKFPSNWELSVARSAAVVRELIEVGVNPSQLAAVGYAEFKPKVDGNSDDDRAENRRVVFLIEKASAKPQAKKLWQKGKGKVGKNSNVSNLKKVSQDIIIDDLNDVLPGDIIDASSGEDISSDIHYPEPRRPFIPSSKRNPPP